MVKGADLDVLECDENNLVNDIININNLEIDDYNNFKIIKKFKIKNSAYLVLEVSSAIRCKILTKNGNKLYVGWRACLCTDYFSVTRCFKCSRFGHISSRCNKDTVCCNCARNHDSKECNSDILKCINCTELNSKLKSSVPVDHRCGDLSKCQAYKKQIDLLITKINYGSSS